MTTDKCSMTKNRHNPTIVGCKTKRNGLLRDAKWPQRCKRPQRDATWNRRKPTIVRCQMAKKKKSTKRLKMAKNRCKNTRMILKMTKYRCKQPQRHAIGPKINTKLLNIDETTGKRHKAFVVILCVSGCQSGAFTCLCPGAHCLQIRP